MRNIDSDDFSLDLGETEESKIDFKPNDVDTIILPSDIPEYDIQDYDFFNEKDMQHYISDLERFIRSSLEYRSMVQYLREYMSMNNCLFLPSITNEYDRRIRIELHHSPLTLFDICNIIFRKRQSCGENLNIENVAFEVLFVHYSLMVGLVPLSETVHELVHNQYIYVPVKSVYGYYREFIKQYYDYIDSELLDKIDSLEKLALSGDYDEYNQVLEKKYITIDMGDNSQLELLHQTQNMLRNRMNELRDDYDQNNQYTMSNPNNIQSSNIVQPISPFTYF